MQPISKVIFHKVKELSKYDVEISGLENKQYTYQFESGNAFFEEYEQSLIESGAFKATMILDRSSTMIQLSFKIVGSVGLVCDRSLESFDEQIDVEERIILKFADKDEELTDEIVLINRNRSRINVATYIFDFIALTLPMKKLHPSLREEEEAFDFEDEDGTLVYSSAQQDETAENPNIDPRWDALTNLKK